MEKVIPLSEYPLADFISLVNKIFSDYAIPINWDVLNFKLDAKENSLSFEDSFVFLDKGNPVGFIVTGIRKNFGRVDAMGVVKEKRGTGLAQKILQYAISHLEWRGVERIVLEVAANDVRAVRFYEKNGFRQVRSLYTLAIRPEDFVGQGDGKFFKTEHNWVYWASMTALANIPRKPNWQRDPMTLNLSESRYNMDRIVVGNEEGYLVWGETDDSSFIVDVSPVRDPDYFQVMIASSVKKIFSETSKSIITISSVPEDDPLYSEAIKVGFRGVFKQYEMCFRLPL